MSIKQTTVNTFSAIKMLIYLLVATFAFLATYPVYKILLTLNMSSLARATVVMCWWLASYTVIYMGTWWAYSKSQGEPEQ